MDIRTVMVMATVPERIGVLLNMRYRDMFGRRSANFPGPVSFMGLVLAGISAPVLAQYDAQATVQQPTAQAGAQQPAGATTAPNVQPGGAADTAAGAAPKRAWSIVPRITVGETLTDNVAPASGNKRGDQVTEISPGIHVTSDSARAKLYLDYSWHKFLYAQESGMHRGQNSLNASGTFEAIEQWMYIDVSGIVAQQDISAFGLQTTSDASINSNRTETSNFRVSPYFRGKLAGYADYELRYSQTAAHTKTSSAFDVDTAEWSGKVGGGTPLANLNWSADINRQSTDYNSGRKSEADQIRGLLSYKLAQQFKVSVSAGEESNDYATPTKETRRTHGFGFDWSPTERTQVSAFRERRFFGESHTFSFNHRMPQSAWKFTDSRNVSILPNRLTTFSLGTYYDLLFNLWASKYPDPAERAAAVNTELQAAQIPPNAQVTGGFLTSRVSVQRRQELSYILQGVRNVLTFTATRSENQGLGAAVGTDDPYLVSDTIRQRGIHVNWSHRLSPLSTLAVTASQQNSTGSGTTSISTKQKSLTTNFSTKIGPNTTATLGARRTTFDSTTLPYSENALTGTLTAQF